MNPASFSLSLQWMDIMPAFLFAVLPFLANIPAPRTNRPVRKVALHFLRLLKFVKISWNCYMKCFVGTLLRNMPVECGCCFLCLQWLYDAHSRLFFVFVSESNLKKELDKEKASLQQSIHKNSALISEKDQEVKNLRSEVRVRCMMTQSEATFTHKWPTFLPLTSGTY